MKIILVQFQTGNTIVEAKQTRKLIKRMSKSRQGLCYSLLFAAYLNFPYYIDLIVTKVRTDGAVLCRPECQSPHTNTSAPALAHCDF